MAFTNEGIKDQFEFLRTNPNAIQRYALELLEQVSNDSITINDPTNPFIFLLETSAILASTAMDESKSRVRELYPTLANKPEDLYRHMSDRDYLNQFSVPGKVTISLVLSVKEIINLAIKVPDQNYKKISIPRDSIFSISEYDFGIYYPIDIRVTVQDGIQIVYDTGELSPLKTISDNKINFSNFMFNNEEFINIDLPMEQFILTSHQRPLNVNVGFNQAFDFSDHFFYCRIYSKVGNDWKELVTTHSKEVFDINVPTAQLAVSGNVVVVTVPLIYFNNNLIGSTLRIDIFTTKGDIGINLGNYTQDNSKYQWRDLGSENQNQYSAPLGKFTFVTVYSTSFITGGKNGESFSEIRDRVVNSRARREVPIRYSELEVFLADRGYQLIKAIDNITDRVMLASKKLPTYGDLALAISGTVEEVIIAEGDLTGNRIIGHGSNFTFFPNGLYRQDGERVIKLNDAEESKLLAMSPIELIEAVRTTDYYYNPLHYSLDKADSYLTFTPYTLTDPKVTSRWNIGESTQAGFQVVSDQINIVYDSTGYFLTISTKANTAFKELADDQVHCQLSFNPPNDSNRVYLNSTLDGMSNGERVFKFILESNFDLDRENYVAFNNFTKIIDDIFSYKINLQSLFHLTFAVSNVSPFKNPAETFQFNLYLGYHLLPKDVQAVSVERLEIKFGQSMDLLLSDSRTSVSSQEYERYDVDVPAVYKSNVYQRNQVGALVLTTDPDTGRRVPVIIYMEGEPVLDESNNPIIEFNKGDIKLVNGKPAVITDRSNLYFLDILLINAIYLFSTIPEQITAFNNIPLLINDYLNNELAGITDILLERTEIYYAPKKTMGPIDIQISKNEKMTINSAQGINVDYFVNPTTNADEKIKETLENSAKEEIKTWINSSTLSISLLISSLTEKLSESILGINVYWQDELQGLDTFTIIDPGDAVSVKQVLTLNYDNTLEVLDSINVQFFEQGV